jgi:hypothetical protein
LKLVRTSAIAVSLQCAYQGVGHEVRRKLVLSGSVRAGIFALILLSICGCSEETTQSTGLQRVVSFDPIGTTPDTFPLAQWVRSTALEAPDSSDLFLESGTYFRSKKIEAPNAKRIEAELCAGCWVVGDVYTQSVDKDSTASCRLLMTPARPATRSYDYKRQHTRMVRSFALERLYPKITVSRSQ